MGILLAFAPFVVFVILERTAGVWEGLAAGALTSGALLLRDAFSAERRVKLLEASTCLLFTGLTAYALMAHGDSWSVAEVRLRVDGGLLAIVLMTVALRRPFTLQYAREKVPTYVWKNPQFIRTNYVITAAWALAFAVMVVADLALVYLPGLPHFIAIVATVAALYAAVRFTSWYPEHVSAPAHR